MTIKVTGSMRLEYRKALYNRSSAVNHAILGHVADIIDTYPLRKARMDVRTAKKKGDGC